jgi:long-subunit fatty acid transport protein
MGLAGAFAGLADDATAAFANPAGLVQLLRPEVSVEGRYWSYSTPYTEGGRITGLPTGNGLDTIAGLHTGESREDVAGLSFLSFVYPRGRWSVALHRHQMAKFRFFSETQGLFFEPAPGYVDRFPDLRTSLELDVVTYGLSGAFRVSEAVSLGLGITYFEGSMDWSAGQYLIDEFPDTFYDPNSYLPERFWGGGYFVVDNTDWSFSLGLLWAVSERWRVGGVYRRGPEFSYDVVNLAGPASSLPPGTVIGAVYDSPIGLPDVYGLGIAYRSSGGSVTVSFEWDRVEYSTVMETIESDIIETDNTVFDDGDELRLGIELVVLSSTPLIAVRGGIWRDPDHRIASTGEDALDRALLRPGKDTNHFALGVGVAFQSIQIDFGADFSEFVDTASLSVIYSF